MEDLLQKDDHPPPPQPPPQQPSHGSKGHYFLKKGGIFQKVIGVTAVAAWLREEDSMCVTWAGYERRWKSHFVEDEMRSAGSGPGSQRKEANRAVRKPFLTAGGTLVIAFDSDPKSHWWKGGQGVNKTLAEARESEGTVYL